MGTELISIKFLRVLHIDYVPDFSFFTLSIWFRVIRVWAMCLRWLLWLLFLRGVRWMRGRRPFLLLSSVALLVTLLVFLWSLNLIFNLQLPFLKCLLFECIGRLLDFFLLLNASIRWRNNNIGETVLVRVQEILSRINLLLELVNLSLHVWQGVVIRWHACSCEGWPDVGIFKILRVCYRAWSSAKVHNPCRSWHRVLR